MASSCKPHAVFIPFPISTHINPMLKFAKLIHQRGFHITFILTHHQHNSILASRGSHALDGLPDFRFVVVPLDVPPPSADRAPAEYFASIRTAVREGFLPLFGEVLGKLNGSSNMPPVTCVVSDGVMTQSVVAAEELRLPVVLFWVVGASGFKSIIGHRDLLRRCLAATADGPEDVSQQVNEDLDTTVDFIPGRKGVRMRDFLKYMRMTHSNDYIIDSCVGEEERTSKASAIIIYTFEALERDVFNEISTMYGRVYSIGPFPYTPNGQVSEKSLKILGDNIWPQETLCVEWLNSKEPNSVIYISFGSLTVVSPKHMVEFAWGLAKSNYSFLWVVRPDMVVGGTMVLPEEFIEETKERGLIVSWCQQEQVLNHQAIGGFLTHCGWSSVLESICAGVAMICWPFFGEHMTSRKNICNEWGVGIEIDEDVKRVQVEEVVRELMDGEKGKMIKEKAKEWKKIAKEATCPFGLSSANIDKLVDEVLLSKP
ncbi:hypothetical protein LguiB_004068 [Lonicera macranthoides]